MRLKSITKKAHLAAVCSLSLLLALCVGLFLHHRWKTPAHDRNPSGPTRVQSALAAPPVPNIDVTDVVQHGHIIEIKANTDPGTTVMVNGERAAVIFDGGGIRHFVGPLPDGISYITITAQNKEGGVNTKQLSVVLP